MARTPRGKKKMLPETLQTDVPAGMITPVNKLAEIERAAEQLTGAEQTELLYFLAQRLSDKNLPLPEPREFSADQLQKWMDQDEADMRRFKAGA